MDTTADKIRQLLIEGYRPYEIIKKFKYPRTLIEHHEASFDKKELYKARQVRIDALAADQRARLYKTSSVVDFDTEIKKCYACGKLKPFTEFSKNKSKWHGMSEECKECISAYHKEHRKPYVRKRPIPKYVPLKPAKPVLSVEQRKIRGLVNSARTRAKEKGLPFDLNWQDLELPEYCPVIPWIKLTYDASDKWSAASLDRTVPSKGYVTGNVTVMSLRANLLKNNTDEKEREAFAAWVLESQKEA